MEVGVRGWGRVWRAGSAGSWCGESTVGGGETEGFEVATWLGRMRWQAEKPVVGVVDGWSVRGEEPV